MVRSEGNMSLKNPVTPSGIDPGTVRLVAQRLNHYATLGRPLHTILRLKFGVPIMDKKIRVFWDVTTCTHVSE